MPRSLALVLLALAAAACARPSTRAGAVDASPAPAAGTDAERQEVLAVVKRLFDGMRAGDSAVIRSVFHSNVQLATALVRQGTPTVRFDSLSVFVRSVGTPRAEAIDERTRNERVFIDGNLAVVWTDYSLYVGTRFIHCGVDAFQLAKMSDGWKIFALADTRRQTGCPDGPPPAR